MFAKLTLNAEQIKGLEFEDIQVVRDLVNVFNAHASSNSLKEKYYEGNVTLNDVNLGLALPSDNALKNLRIGCDWGAKTVDVLASRSVFDGFVSGNGEISDVMEQIADDNKLVYEYNKACRDELKYGCTFVTLSADDNIGCRIRFHSPRTASALWDGVNGRIRAGLSIVDTVMDEADKSWRPRVVIVYLSDKNIILENNNGWTATYEMNSLDVPMMVPMVWNATAMKPFGRSRLKKPVRALIDGYVRTIANATIGLEFSTAPQKYLMGITDEQYDALVSKKFQQYIGSVLLATSNPETGEKPTFGQLPQGNISSHVEMMRLLATQFSAATGLSVTDTGVVNNANPTSSDAILAQTQTLVTLAEQLNAGNGDALKMIARMAVAIAENKTLGNLTEEEMDVVAHFKNPAMPSVSVTADAAIKISSSRQGFASTDVFLEMVGFGQADIRRIKAQEQRARGQRVLEELNEKDSTIGMD